MWTPRNNFLFYESFFHFVKNGDRNRRKCECGTLKGSGQPRVQITTCWYHMFLEWRKIRVSITRNSVMCFSVYENTTPRTTWGTRNSNFDGTSRLEMIPEYKNCYIRFSVEWGSWSLHCWPLCPLPSPVVDSTVPTLCVCSTGEDWLTGLKSKLKSVRRWTSSLLKKVVNKYWILKV
jgi:hypothetical protein